MGVYAFGLIVFGEVEGAKLSLIVEHVEVIILKVVMDEGGQYLLLAMGIGAEISIGALTGAVWVM